MQHFPTIVLGAGSGGLTVALGLAALGRAVALVEPHAVGGDCTNVGCIPSKTLIHLASQPAAATNAAAILATVQQKRDHLRDEETELVAHTTNLTFLRGRGRLIGPRELKVQGAGGTARYTADHIVIATGSRPRLLEIPGLPAARLLTNETLFEQATPPRHLAVVGSGPIGLEMAFAFRRLGAAVTVITKDRRVLQVGSADAAATVDAALHEAGIGIVYRATPSGYDDGGERLALSDGATLSGVDRVLVAIGRVRNVDTLNLDAAGVQWSADGIPTDRANETNVRGIFAIGDVTVDSKWTHSANAQGRRVVQRIAFPWLPMLSAAPLYPNATFTDPEVANVGLVGADLARRYHPALLTTLRYDLAQTDKGYTEGLRHGFVQVHAVRLTGRIVGATVVGPRASEMISLFTLAITARISLYRLYRLVYPYPTLSGAVQKVADAFVRQTLPHFPAELAAFARFTLATHWRRGRAALGLAVTADTEQSQ